METILKTSPSNVEWTGSHDCFLSRLSFSQSQPVCLTHRFDCSHRIAVDVEDSVNSLLIHDLTLMLEAIIKPKRLKFISDWRGLLRKSVGYLSLSSANGAPQLELWYLNQSINPASIKQ